MADYLTPEQLAEFQEIERSIMRRRGERSIAKAAAEKAKAQEAKPNAAAPPSPFPSAPYRCELIDGATAPKLSTSQAQEMAEAFRANYIHYDDEHIALLEKRLQAAAQSDGWSLPPLSDDARLKILQARQAAKST